MKLSKEQIKQLKKLISYKGYPEIDVQYEILDHVACNVEELLEENPSLNLEEAFRKVHASFGIFGFSGLEESYKKAIEKRMWTNYKQEIKRLLTSYRLLFPILLGLLIYQTSILLEDPKAWVLLLAGFVLAGSAIFIITYWKKYQYLKNYASFMGSTQVFQALNMGILASLYSYQFVYKSSEEGSFLFFSIFKIIITVVLVGFAISSFILPRLLRQSISETEKLKKLYESVEE
ncbi:hypothetical protein [Algoriphagus hitonicola]|uniref:Uncharacterized protein n=1 Tax=Algoriphagus hitonicola TaxID=435880 RepID=A0A1I2NLY5_9BACT|nr:hypothetical protein [Algoriphagus hitonicola]SFG04040.1 hypothetical protein SAMN04487988_101165 [Algoriphagus hitonicola]